ncbi:phage holin family protein [Actinomadura bangladeshensis]|uniref:Phage holin family protein n=1 Tax=Actinomadura bangladeshensis TaxID=453573 RepID=A0A6L9QIX6_9ACTN|nr:phage holin family protein [Actinomadura bangladeshensis]NEA25460.1 phage holin family protein [Actinomadura bangladeshensis]
MSEALPGERIEDKSVGELVALASGSISDLVRAEMTLAKMELKADAKKAALSSMMLTIAAVMGGLIVILLSIAFALGLTALGIWSWAAFLIVAGVYAVLALFLMWLAKKIVKRIEGAKRTRKTLKDDFTALRRRGDAKAIDAEGGSRKTELTD